MPYGMLIDGQPVELTPGEAFITHKLVVTTPEEAAWTMEPIGTVIARDVSHSPGALAGYDDADLARFLIQKFDEGAPAPEGHQVATRNLVVNDAGVISVAVTYELTPPPPVPAEVSMMQAQLALQNAGLLDQVEAAVAAADATTKIYWKTAAVLHRAHPVVTALGAAINLTPENIDALFVAAAALS